MGFTDARNCLTTTFHRIIPLNFVVGQKDPPPDKIDLRARNWKQTLAKNGAINVLLTLHSHIFQGYTLETLLGVKKKPPLFLFGICVMICMHNLPNIFHLM